MPVVFAAPGHKDALQHWRRGDVERAFVELEAEFTAQVLVDERWIIEEWDPEAALVRYWTAELTTDPYSDSAVMWKTEGWR